MFSVVTYFRVVTIRRVLEWMIGFTGTLYTQLVTTITSLLLFPHFTVHCYTH
jgi:hypothetical protein